MKFILLTFFLSIIWCSVLITSEIQKIKKVEGQIKMIDFDSDFPNSYIISRINESDWFYKLDNKKNIVLTKNFLDVENLLISNNGDVYVFSYWNTGHNAYLSVLGKNDTNFKILSVFYSPPYYSINAFSDNDGNIFFNTKYGVSLLKRKQGIVEAIKNLESNFFSHYLIDGSGDVYLRVFDMQSNFRTVLVTSESTLRLSNIFVPYAKNVNMEGQEFYPINNGDSQTHIGNIGTYTLSNSRRNYYGNGWGNTCNGEVYCFENLDDSKATIEKVDDNQVKILHTEYDSAYRVIYETENRLFLTSEKVDEFFNIYFITKDDEVIAIKDTFTRPTINSTQCASDKNQNVFFGHKKSITVLKNDRTESTKIEIPSDEDISFILMDENDDLWVLARDLYMVRNNTENAEWLYSLPIGADPLMKENKLTNEIFIASGNGLFVCKN